MLTKLKAFVLMAIMIALMATQANAQQDLSFVTPDGQTVSLSGLRGKVVVLLFGGAHDPQCKDEFKALQSLAERYQNKGVSIYWVSVNSPADANLKGRQRPTIVVLDQQGQVHGQPRGGFNPNSDFVNDLAAVIDSLLNRK